MPPDWVASLGPSSPGYGDGPFVDYGAEFDFEGFLDRAVPTLVQYRSRGWNTWPSFQRAARASAVSPKGTDQVAGCGSCARSRQRRQRTPTGEEVRSLVDETLSPCDVTASSRGIDNRTAGHTHCVLTQSARIGVENHASLYASSQVPLSGRGRHAYLRGWNGDPESNEQTPAGGIDPRFIASARHSTPASRSGARVSTEESGPSTTTCSSFA
jgi:hypothetical protein